MDEWALDMSNSNKNIFLRQSSKSQESLQEITDRGLSFYVFSDIKVLCYLFVI